jgi:hypothetical protein
MSLLYCSTSGRVTWGEGEGVGVDEGGADHTVDLRCVKCAGTFWVA